MKEIIFEKTEKKYYVSTINRCLKEIQRSEVEEIKNYTDTLKSYSDLIISLYVYCANLNDLLNVQAESEMKIPNLLDIDTFSRPNQCVSNALSSFYC